MIDIMLGLLSDVKPAVSSIIDCREVTHRDLSVLEIRYVQGNSYFAARAYATGSWIAKSPLGPEFAEDGTLQMHNINDIAFVDCYNNATDLRRRKWPRLDELVVLQQHMDESAKEMVIANFPSLRESLHKASFSFSPVPTIQLCFAVGPSYKTMLGTIAVDTMDNVTVTSRVSPEIDVVADLMRGKGRLLTSKGVSIC